MTRLRNPIQTKPAFLIDDIITTLSTIITKHITHQQKEDQVYENAINDNQSDDDDDDGDDGDGDQNDQNDKKTKKNKNLIRKKLQSTIHKTQLQYLIPYSILQDAFYTYTNHGWSSEHLLQYGTLKHFIIKHSNIFIFHVPTQRIGLVQLFPNHEYLNLNSNFEQKNIINGVIPDNMEEYCYDNSIWLGTSLHLHRRYDGGGNGGNGGNGNDGNNKSNLLLDFNNFEHFLEQKRTINNNNNNNQNNTNLYNDSYYQDLITQRLTAAAATAITPIQSIPNILTQTAFNKPIINISDSTKQTDERNNQNNQNNNGDTKLSKKLHQNNLSFDSDDIDEKLKNRGCAPQRTNQLQIPLMILFIFITFWVILGVMLETNIIYPDQISQPDTPIFNIIIKYQHFIHDLCHDLHLFGYSR
jgi:hypothetical protein